ncbi:MAG: glycosyltransferase [Promethearchaeota archaeon]|jgi:glycosyltransferase involved in cell wall biosynthesis
MRVLFLSDSDSPHTIRWAKSLRENNIEVAIFSIHTPNPKLYADTPDIFLSSSNAPRELQTKRESNLSKIVYLRSVNKVRKLIKDLRPDILHTHYASSYGLTGALAGFHPYIISVWGSDIYSFPHYSIIHHSIIKFSLSRADIILSTGIALKKETEKFAKKEILITPFGIDIKKFFPEKVKSIFTEPSIIVGTIKTLEKRYGIEYLIKAFAKVKNKYAEKSLKLLIVGQGTQREYLQSLVLELGIEDDTIFTGFVNHDEIIQYHNMLDIFVAASLEESFGVSVLEASACGKPVVVSNVGGLPEVVDQDKTGFLVDKENPELLAEAIGRLVCNPDLRGEMGRNGRQKVIDEYDWEDSVKRMISIYESKVFPKNEKNKFNI